jgi:hypothetical protein
MRTLLSRLLFMVGSFAFSYSMIAFTLIEGPLSPPAVELTAQKFVADPVGQELIKDSLHTALTTAEIDEKITTRIESALLEDPAFMPSVVYALSSRYNMALGEDPSAMTEGVKPLDEVVRTAARRAGVPKAAAERLTVPLPELRMPFGAWMRRTAEQLWWPLMRLSFLLFFLSALAAPRLSRGIERVGRLLLSSSLFAALLAFVLPWYASRQESPRWRFTGTLLSTAFASSASLLIMLFASGLVLRYVPGRFRKSPTNQSV